jgi:alkylhydroperoxidase family enzyme
VQQVLDDYTTAPIGDTLRATLGLLKTMTLDHGNLAPEDVRAVLRTGVSKQAIQDALEVAFLFNIYDRLADSMGWHVPELNGGYYQVAAKRLLKQGYG